MLVKWFTMMVAVATTATSGLYYALFVYDCLQPQSSVDIQHDTAYGGHHAAPGLRWQPRL